MPLLLGAGLDSLHNCVPGVVIRLLTSFTEIYKYTLYYNMCVGLGGSTTPITIIIA